MFIRVILLSLALHLSWQGLNPAYTVNTDFIDTSATSTSIVAGTAFGTCTCDITSNTCDIYCCCDTDCSAEILDLWKANYDLYCTK